MIAIVKAIEGGATGRSRAGARPLIAALVAALLALPVTARAAPAGPTVPAEPVAALPLAFDGDLPASWRAELAVRVREGLGRDGREVLAIEVAAGCDDACARAQAAGAGARWLARTSVAVRARDFTLRLSLVDLRTGAIVSETEASCEVCAVAEVGDVLADRAAVLAAKLASLAQASPRFRFDSAPDGAALVLDGKAIGTAPTERTVEPGRHRVGAKLPGYAPLELQFDAVAGTREALRLELSPLPPKPGLRRGGWAAVGIGLGMVGIGAPLIAVHGRPYRDRCSGDNVDAEGDCRFRLDTRTGGAVAVSVGVAALITGVALLVVGSRRARSDRRTSRLVVGGVPGSQRSSDLEGADARRIAVAPSAVVAAYALHGCARARGGASCGDRSVVGELRIDADHTAVLGDRQAWIRLSGIVLGEPQVVGEAEGLGRGVGSDVDH